MSPGANVCQLIGMSIARDMGKRRDTLFEVFGAQSGFALGVEMAGGPSKRNEAFGERLKSFVNELPEFRSRGVNFPDAINQEFVGLRHN